MSYKSSKERNRPWRLLIFIAALGLFILIGCQQKKNITPDKPLIQEPPKKTAEELRAEEKQRILGTFKDLDMQKEGLNLSYGGKSLEITLPVYVNFNRYYIPFTELIYSIDGDQEVKDGLVEYKLKNKSLLINTVDNSCKSDSLEYVLRQKAILTGEILYLSLFDVTKILNLKTDWKYENKSIAFFNNIDNVAPEPAGQSGKTALVRLEDFHVGQYRREDQLEKLRIMTDYLYSKNVPFHIAWIPRSVLPRAKVDIDMTVQYCMENANFLYTIDYFVEKNGVVGIHGYTHQHGDEDSGGGTEFSSRINASEKETRYRIEKAMEIAKKLDIPYYFFESPHYAATQFQLKLAEEYFDIIYQPRDKYVVSHVKSGSRTIKYVPTPLDFVHNKNHASKLLRDIDTLPSNALGSFFYHPDHEMEFIQLSKDEKGYPTYTYSDDGILKKIVHKLHSKGFKFEKITSLP